MTALPTNENNPIAGDGECTRDAKAVSSKAAEAARLSVDDARSLLMGEDILPMTAEEVEEARATEEAARQIATEQAAGAAFDEGDVYQEGTVGLGVDIVEIERMVNILSRRPGFAYQVFSPDERAYCTSTSRPATHFALRFAAKEAVVKALGTGFSQGIWVRDIEVRRARSGRPFVALSGRAKEVAAERGVREISLSLSYTNTDAVACALAITQKAVAATQKRKDPMEELARQFKETRKMLDDL